jgi:hypothetical protein
MKSIKRKDISLTAELVKTPCSVLVQNINEEYDNIEDLDMYFSNELSGGGAIQDVRLIGNGKAVITFTDPEGTIGSVHACYERLM